MYIKRRIEEKMLFLLEHFPAVAILGPRQTGKTTLVKEIRKRLVRDTVYLDLENPVDAGALDHASEFLNSVSDKTVIIDEVQRKPDLFPVLRSVIDQNRINGRFILLGSASPQLMFLSNETLSGRIVYLELTPFVLSEIESLADFRDHWLRGGFPVPFLQQDPVVRKEWFKSFLSAYFERDLRMLGLNSNPGTLNLLFMMISALQGSILNYSGLSNSLGVSSPTVSNAISFFERSYIVRLLKPWYANIGKRLLKSPKIYIRDSGIINYLSGIFSYEGLLIHPFLGKLWEGYVIELVINTLGDDFSFFYYRTADGTECDLLIFKGMQCMAALDIKFSSRPSRTKSMYITLKDIKPSKSFYVIPENPEPYSVGENQFVVTPNQLIHILREKL